jgi:hypothetical protein
MSLEDSLSHLKIKETGTINKLLIALSPLDSYHPFIARIDDYKEKKRKG